MSHGAVAAHWEALVATAMLGTDRRDPPPPPAPIADLVDDTVRTSPSERMLAEVAATVAVRRAGVTPDRPHPPLAGPPADDRPPCSPAAVERWHHVTTSWPVLEDEWLLALLASGRRVAPELVPSMLARHRSDPVRRARAELACGPLGEWLVTLVPELAAGRSRMSPADEAAALEHVGELPGLPIPPELRPLLSAPAEEVALTLAAGIETGTFVHAQRAVLVNVVARVRPDTLPSAARALDAVDTASSGHGLASVLADLAGTRHRMLDELSSTASLDSAQ